MERADILRELMNKRNCAQCVLGAFADETGYDIEETDRIAAHFGGGMHMGQTCGCVTGALMAIGMMESDKAAEFEEKFAERFGSTVCYELLGNMKPQDAVASGKTLEICPDYIKGAIEIVNEIMEQ